MKEVIVFMLDGEELTFSPVDEVNLHDSPDVLVIHMGDWSYKIVIPFDSMSHYKETTP
jgi:hypothetical protein